MTEEEIKDKDLNYMNDLNDPNNRLNEESHKNSVKIYERCATTLRYIHTVVVICSLSREWLQVQKDCKRNDYH